MKSEGADNCDSSISMITGAEKDEDRAAAEVAPSSRACLRCPPTLPGDPEKNNQAFVVSKTGSRSRRVPSPFCARVVRKLCTVCNQHGNRRAHRGADDSYNANQSEESRVPYQSP